MPVALYSARHLLKAKNREGAAARRLSAAEGAWKHLASYQWLAIVAEINKCDAILSIIISTCGERLYL